MARIAPTEPNQLLELLRGTIVGLCRDAQQDLTARQLGVFLTTYLVEGDHTVRGLAERLNVSKPAITRALDRLGELSLVRRKADPRDRRSVLATRTAPGDRYLQSLRAIMTDASVRPGRRISADAR